MKINTLIKNQKGLTLIEMLIAILIFILAAVFIVSLVTNSLDKPKEAGIMSDFNHYEKTGALLLKTVKNNVEAETLEAEFNVGLDKQAQFDVVGTDLVSKKENAYNNPYKLEVLKETLEEPNQTAIVINTVGKSTKKKYKVVIVKEGKTVESCTFGFGRNDKKLKTLLSKYCNDTTTEVGEVDNGDTEYSYTPVTVVPDGCTPITTAAELDAVRLFLDDCYIQMNPIDLTSYPNWVPIIGPAGEAFIGSFDGQRYAITNLAINQPLVTEVALFKKTGANAIFANVNLVDVNVTGGATTASLIATAYGTEVTNTSVSGVINSTGNNTGGLIGVTDEVTLTNTGSSANVTGAYRTGGLVGDLTDTNVLDSKATGEVKGTGNTGGLIGEAYNNSIFEITNSFSTGSVFGDGDVGGLVGYANDYIITDSHSTGLVTANYDVGGLLGALNGGSVTNSYATGDVNTESNYYVGGLIGYADTAEVTNSYSTGDILNAISEPDELVAGGFIGYSYDMLIKDSYSTGNVSGYGTLGGFIGEIDWATKIEKSYSTGNVQNGEVLDTQYIQNSGGFIGAVRYGSGVKMITNSYSTGNVSGALSGVKDSTGGFIGLVETNTTIANSLSTGTVEGSPLNGGFIGKVYKQFSTPKATVTNSYYNSATGITDANGATAKTLAELKQQPTYVGWDFSTIWQIKDSSYPTLR